MADSKDKLVCCVCATELDPKGEFAMTHDYRAACPGCVSKVAPPRHRSRLEQLRVDELRTSLEPTRQPADNPTDTGSQSGDER